MRTLKEYLLSIVPCSEQQYKALSSMKRLQLINGAHKWNKCRAFLGVYDRDSKKVTFTELRQEGGTINSRDIVRYQDGRWEE